MNPIYNKETLLKRLQHYGGLFECHITVVLSGNRVQDFCESCYALNAKPIVIELSSGATSFQPMLSKRLSGEAIAVLASIEELEAQLSAQYDVTRIKVEAALSNHGIPSTNGDAISSVRDCYFEHHVKVLLDKTEDRELLRRNLESLQGHLSRNALNQLGDTEQRFITQRFYNTGQMEAAENLEKLINFLTLEKITILDQIREYNIYDSNVDLDSGWINDVK